MKKLKERFNRKSSLGLPQQQQQQQNRGGAPPPASSAAGNRPGPSPVPSASNQSWQVVEQPWEASSTNSTHQRNQSSTSAPQYLSPPGSYQLSPPQSTPSPAPSGAGSIFTALFADPQILLKLAQNPHTQSFLSDFSFLSTLERLRQNPENTQQELAAEPRIQTVINVLLGLPVISAPSPAPPPASSAPPAPPASLTVTPPIPTISAPQPAVSPIIQQPVPQPPQQSHSPIFKASTPAPIPSSPAVSYQSSVPPQLPTPQPQTQTPYQIPPQAAPQELPTNAPWQNSPPLPLQFQEPPKPAPKPVVQPQSQSPPMPSYQIHSPEPISYQKAPIAQSPPVPPTVQSPPIQQQNTSPPPAQTQYSPNAPLQGSPPQVQSWQPPPQQSKPPLTSQSSSQSSPQSQPYTQPQAQTYQPYSPPQNRPSLSTHTSQSSQAGPSRIPVPPPPAPAAQSPSSQPTTVDSKNAAEANLNRIKARDAEEVNRIKAQANDAFKQGNYNKAIQLYTSALTLDPKNAVILSNRSSAYLLSVPPKVLEAHADAKAATEADPNYWKAWSRLGEAKLKLDDAQAAVEAFEWAEALAGNQLGEATKASLKTAREKLAAVNARKGTATAQKSASTAKTPQPSSSAPQAPPKIPIPNLSASKSGPSSGVPSPPAAQPQSQATPSRNTSTTSAASPMANVTEGMNRVNISSNNSNAQQPTAIGQFTENPSSEQTQDNAQGGRAVSNNPSAAGNDNDILGSAGLANLANLDSENPAEAPPAYLPNLSSSDPTIRAISVQNMNEQLTNVTTTLAQKNKGAVAVKTYVGYGPDRTSFVDAVQAVFISMAQGDLTPHLRGESKFVEHPSFEGMFINTMDFPGSVFHDMDMEVSKYYEGYYPGTVGVAGYSEEYRAQQLEQRTTSNMLLYTNDPVPHLTIERVIQRFQSDLLNPLVFGAQTVGQLYNNLRELVPAQILTFDQLITSPTLNFGLKQQISEICLVLNREDPQLFRDFTKERNVFNHIFNLPAASGNSRGLGFRAFLFQMLLGYELFLRLMCEPSFPPPGLITNNVAATMQLSIQFKANVDVIRNNTIGLSEPFLVVSKVEQRQREGLLRFAELINWPFMQEVHNYIQTAYQNMGAGGSVGLDTCDWLFGLIAPGKIFRHRIMCTLVEATASIKNIRAAPHYNDGLVITTGSYWPKRTPLGRVLGGISKIKNIVGWVGPAPRPKTSTGLDMPIGWYLIYSELPRIPVPCTKTQDAATDLEEQGFGRPEPGDTDATRWLSGITDVNHWVTPEIPPRPDMNSTTVTLEAIKLAEYVPPNLISGLYTAAPPQPRWHKATIDFLINNRDRVSYQIHTTPIFLSAHPCVGNHVLHKKQTAKYLEDEVSASQLHLLPASRAADTVKFLFIDARAPGEEVLARAWCAEKRRHAVIRRSSRNGTERDSCFACAAQMAGSYGGKGVAFNVLIWST